MICSSCGRSNRSGARFCGTCGTPLQVADTPIVAGTFNGSWQALTAGTTLGLGGRYRIDRTLGKGGFGETYRALDTQLGRFCVVKRAIISPGMTVREQEQLLDSFAREARLLVTLNEPGHDNIPEIYEYLADDRCLVMKYIEGRSLEDVLNRQVDGLPEEVALRYMRDICSALVYMHGRATGPVLHRDLKPANILLGNDGRVWLIDFGLAKTNPTQSINTSSRASLTAGTLGYTPPEQWRGAAEARSDVYALAATLHHLLTNHRPARSELLALMQGRDDVFPPVRQLNPNIRPEVEQLISRALVADVAARPTAQSFFDTLEALLAQPHVPPPPEPARPPIVNDFVGRDAELEVFKAQLSDRHLAVITGLAGVGKTTLACALAQQADDQNQTFWHAFHKDESIDGVIWELAGFLAWHGQDDLWRLLNTSNQNSGQAPPFELLLDYLLQTVRGQGYLLCFDDVQFVDNDPLFERLLSGLHQTWQSGGGAVIITSRHVPAFVRLGEIAPLPGLSLVDTRRLLTQRGVTLPDDLADELYRRTEGNAQFLTLAIDALRRAPNPAKLIDRLTETTDIERYLLREVHAGLSGDERDVMGVVAVLLGYGGTRDAIEAILDTISVRAMLHDLSQRHLLIVTEGETDREYAQHAIVQAFYYDNLKKSARQNFHRRAGAYYETEELDTLKAARHYERAGEYERAATLATKDLWVQINRGQARGLRALLEQLNVAQIGIDTQIAVLTARGHIEALLSSSERARSSYQEALKILDILPDQPSVRMRKGHVYYGIGTTLEFEAPRDALTWLHNGLAYLKGLNDPEEAALLIKTGTVLIELGEYDAAGVALEQGQELLPEEPGQLHISAFQTLGTLFSLQGDIKRGMEYTQRGLQLCRQLHDYVRLAKLLSNLAIDKSITGDLSGALADFEEALEVAERLGDRAQCCILEMNIGITYIKTSELESAQRYLLNALEHARETEARSVEVAIQSSLGDLAIRQHDLPSAIEALTKAESLALAIDAKGQLPEIYRNWALLSLLQGDQQRMLEYAHQSLDLARTLKLDLDEGIALRVLGQALAANGRYAESIEAFTCSLEILDGNDVYEAAWTRTAWENGMLQQTLDKHSPV